jgi:5-methylthioadenosine/S-adenosylhomocysteine deaminase
VTTVDEEALLGEARDLFGRLRAERAGAGAEAERLLPAYRAMVERARTADVGMNRWVGA